MNKKGRRRSDRSRVLICHNTGDIKTKKVSIHLFYFALHCTFKCENVFLLLFYWSISDFCCFNSWNYNNNEKKLSRYGFFLCCLSDFLHLFINVFTCVCLTGALQLHVVAPTQRMLLMRCTNVLIHQEAVCWGDRKVGFLIISLHRVWFTVLKHTHTHTQHSRYQE